MELNGVDTVKYAAVKAAVELGYPGEPPGGRWAFLKDNKPVDPEDSISFYDGDQLALTILRR